MCLSAQIMPPKITHEGAPHRFFIPCGHCKDCDEVYQASWAFRLRVELEHLAMQGWQIAFATLTYKDLCLPHMPPCVFKEKIKYKSVQCFSRTDATNFIHALRSYLWREYHLEGQLRLRYFLCSEFGSHTKRSHYHLVLAFPPCVDARKVFRKVHLLWEPKGHVFPRYFDGGFDSKGYKHKPFVVTSASAAARYIAKYTTKDMYYFEHLQENDLSFSDFNTKMDVYKDCRQFHLGSKSLGFSILENATDDQKMKMLKYGYSFVGDHKYYTIPLYFKNRLIYDNVYQYAIETPNLDEDILFYRFKRLVRRDANVFFLEHFEEIFSLKVGKYAELFRMMQNPKEYRNRGVQPDILRLCIKSIGEFKQRFDLSNIDLAQYYLAIYGVPYDRLKHYALSVCWLNHYCDVDLYDKLFQFRGFVPISKPFYFAFHAVISCVFDVFFGVPKEYSQFDKLVMKVKDFLSSAA